MPHRNKNRLGPNGKQNKISLKIRRDIREGVYAPGEKLPPRTELEQRYNSSTVTVQKAFDKLKEDGYIYSDGPKGTFVSENPPCFSNYAIVFPDSLRHYHSEVNFYSILANLTQKRSADFNCSFEIYTNLNGHVDEPDYIRLYDDVKHDRLAGIIFAKTPADMENTPLFKKILKKKYLPKVAFMGEYVYPDIPTIHFYSKEHICTIFDLLEKKNVKRLAVITYQSDVNEWNHSSSDIEADVFLEANKRGIDLPKYNFQVRHPALALRTSDLSHLILKGSKDERPQALWIMNDSLVEAATKGVVDAGLNTPDDLLVITHCNFPEKPHSFVDSSWYGLDVLQFINLALDILKKHRRGEEVPSVTMLPAKYEL